MGFADAIAGLAKGFSSSLKAEQQTRRKEEDDKLGYMQDLIHQYLQNPAANPEFKSQAMTDMINLHMAQVGPRKAKGGVEGLLGSTETPESSFIKGLLSAAHPYEGTTTEQVPQAPQRAPQPAGGATGVPMVSTPGAEVGSAPGASGGPSAGSVGMPPAPVLDQNLWAASQAVGPMQPPAVSAPQPKPMAQQPYFMSQQETAQRTGQAKGIEAGAETAAQFDAEMKAAIATGADPATAREMVLEKHGLKKPTAPKVTKGPIVEYKGPDGTVKRAQSYMKMMPDGSVSGVNEFGMPLPPDAQPVQGGNTQAGRYARSTDKQGNVWLIDQNDKTVSLMSGPGGKPIGKPQQAPQGSTVVLASPEDGSPAAYKVVGTQASPIKLPGGTPALKPVAPEKMSAAGKQALQGIKVVQGVAPQIMKTLQEIGLSNNPLPQAYDLALAKKGISPGDVEEQLLQTLGIADAYGLRGLMGGRPNMRLIDIVRVHLPQPGDSTQLAYDKLQTLTRMMPTLQQAIMEAETAQLPQKNPYEKGKPVTPPPAAPGASTSGTKKNPFLP